MKLYLIERGGAEESFLKVGVTQKSDPDDRHYYGVTKVVDSKLPFDQKIKRLLGNKQKYMEEGPYPKVRPVITLEFQEESQARFLEHSAIENFKSVRYTPKAPYTGASECFIYSKENETNIRSFLEAEHKKMTDWRFLMRYKLASFEVRSDDPIERHLAIIKAMKR